MPQIREQLILEDHFTQSFTEFIQFAQRAASSMDTLQGSLANIETATARTALATENLGTSFSRSTASSASTSTAVDGLTRRLLGLASAYAGIQTVSGLVNLSDTFTQTTARLDLMNDGLQTTQELTQMIYQSAQASRGSFTETANMVAQLGTLAGNAFDNTQEIVAFAEQLNKQMAISGTSAQEGSAAMLQLTQAMASGVLRGEELNSVMEQTPMIANTIAEYLGVSTGKLREMAAEGQITAEVVKNAMFWAADETNAKFEEMPMTWAQVWQSFQNTATMALQPVLNAINWLANNIQIIAPIVLGLATAFGVFLIAANWIQICAAVTNFLTTAQAMLGVVMATVWGPIVIVIVLVIAAIYAVVAAINKLTGSTISATGLITGAIAVALAFIGNIFVAAFNLIMDGLVFVVNAFIGVANIIATVFSNPARAAVGIIHGMADAILSILEGIASAIDTLFGSNLAGAVSGWRSKLSGWVNEKWGDLDVVIEPFDAESLHMDRVNYGDAFNSGYDWGSNLSFGGLPSGGNMPSVSIPAAADPSSLLGDIGKSSGKTADNTGALKKSVDMTNEDLQMLVDLAERQYVAQVNLTSQTPVINVTGQNTGNTAADRTALADAIKTVLLEQRASGTYRAYARV